MAASGKEISEEAFKNILADVSAWFDQRPYMNLLKVLYRDHVANMFELDNASKMMDLVNLLIDSGDLSPRNLTIIYDTIKATKQFGLLDKLKEKIPDCPNVRKMVIKSFSLHRQRLVMLGMSLRQLDMAKISELYNDPVKEYIDGWNLIMDLEHRRMICEGRMEVFIESLVKLKLPLAVEALTQGNREASSTSSSPNIVNVMSCLLKKNNPHIRNPQLISAPKTEEAFKPTDKNLTFRKLLETKKETASNLDNGEQSGKDILQPARKRKIRQCQMSKRQKFGEASSDSESEEINVDSDDEYKESSHLVKPEIYHKYIESTSNNLVIVSSDTASDWSDISDNEKERHIMKSESEMKKALVLEPSPKIVPGIQRKLSTDHNRGVGPSSESFQNLELLSLVSTHSASGKSCIDNLLCPRPRDEPYVEILEQPKQREFRFRYQVEGRSASISGERSVLKKKSFPAIKIYNYNGCVRVVVSLVTNETGTAKPKPHPYGLVGKDCENGVCTKIALKSDSPIEFDNLGIQRIKQKEIFSALLVRLNHGVDPFKNFKLTTTDRKKLASQYDLSVVCLCFQVYLIKKDPEPDIALEPVVSQPIFDKNYPALEMIQIDRRYGMATGGDKIFILCSKIQRDDISVKFFDADWSDYAKFSAGDVHRQVAIVCRTPPYKDQNIVEPKRVYFKLVRPSDKDGSQAVPFTYFPNKKKNVQKEATG